MEEKRHILIRADQHTIEKPEIFDTYYEAFNEMKRQYEVFSDGCCGELNDDDAWCMDGYHTTNWKIFEM